MEVTVLRANIIKIGKIPKGYCNFLESTIGPEFKLLGWGVPTDIASYKTSIAKVTRARNKEMADIALKSRVLVNGYMLYHMKYLRDTVRQLREPGDLQKRREARSQRNVETKTFTRLYSFSLPSPG